MKRTNFASTGSNASTFSRCVTGGRINGPGGAAELLGIKPNTLRARMDRLGVSYGRRRTRPAADDRGGER